MSKQIYLCEINNKSISSRKQVNNNVCFRIRFFYVKKYDAPSEDMFIEIGCAQYLAEET